MDQKFLDLIKEALEIEDREPQMEDAFKEYNEWDSLSQLTLIAELDDQFGVTVTSDELKGIITLQELLDQVKKAQG
ncbi:acyl carrier protein [Lunatibacter salilacus]|uniref:acyl carrier protein n=1 Tax=Lunatibacter salilacus TaxID=2483804 RepID=UPI00131B1FE7|nr:acyl carrier protein [Lunatibacter salilacus]